MTHPPHSREARLPANQVDLDAFDRILALFESEFDQLICQADLPTTFLITEDPADFRDAIGEYAHVTNIRVRGWSHQAGAGPVLGELLLTDHRAEIRVDGSDDPDRTARFVAAVAGAISAARRPWGILYSPWLVALGLLVGAAGGALLARGLGQPGWISPLVALVPGGALGVLAALAVISSVQLTIPYAGVKGLGLRPGGQIDPAACGRPRAAGEESGRGVA